jgi:protein phosphatase
MFRDVEPRAAVPGLDGLGARPDDPAREREGDDFCVHPGLGLAVVARGHGAIGGQGKPAAKLAVWSLLGELEAYRDGAPQKRLRRGLQRAEAAVERLSANWPEGLLRPFVSLAAALLDGDALVVAHVGACGVARLREGVLTPLTRPHTLGAEFPDAPPGVAQVLTRGLGRGGEPSVQRVAALPGDMLLLLGATPTDHALVLAALLGVGQSLLGERLRRLVAAIAGPVALIRITARPTQTVVRGSTRAPRLPWLYRPGAPLVDPPKRHAPGAPGRGPDARWFAEVHAGVMAGEE